MKLITTSSLLEKEFRRLTKEYSDFYWATAWAGINSKPFDDLISNQNKIKKIIVGIHFYQTHPDFIESFRLNKGVRFILQPEGTFHPKIYLFTNGERKWEILIGSGNFTKGAFSKNREATVLISSEDDPSGDIYKNTRSLIEDIWKEATYITESQLLKYRSTWEIQKSKIKSLSGLYGSKKRQPVPIHEVRIINMDWNEFITEVKNEKKHGPVNRLKVLTKSNELFGRTNHFNELTEDERKFIAGVPNKLDSSIDWGLFGSMQGSGVFKNKIILNDKNISNALDQIPLSGQITRTHYNNFLYSYQRTFSGNFLGTATRLLCMKRPDTFVCLDSKNKSSLCRAFGIIQSEMNYERYWDDIIERIYDSNWWLNPNPKNELEQRISNSRAAFLDSLYYQE